MRDYRVIQSNNHGQQFAVIELSEDNIRELARFSNRSEAEAFKIYMQATAP
jgi:hypothetical protein